MLPAASKAGKEAANVCPESQGRAMEVFFLMEPSGAEAETLPFNCNRE